MAALSVEFFGTEDITTCPASVHGIGLSLACGKFEEEKKRLENVTSNTVNRQRSSLGAAKGRDPLPVEDWSTLEDCINNSIMVRLSSAHPS